MNAVFMQLFEEFRDKISLQKRLAACYRHAAAVLPVRTEAQRPAHQLVRVGRRAALGQPGVGVVAVDAAQGTALHEHHIAHARPVDRAEGLDGVDKTGHFRRFLSCKMLCAPIYIVPQLARQRA